jgi:hypothetical protein
MIIFISVIALILFIFFTVSFFLCGFIEFMSGKKFRLSFYNIIIYIASIAWLIVFKI